MDKKMFNMSEFYRECTEDRDGKNAVSNNKCMICNDDKEAYKDISCDCVLAMAFVNMQPLDTVYPLQEAFSNGTLFPNLNKPFLGGNLR